MANETDGTRTPERASADWARLEQSFRDAGALFNQELRRTFTTPNETQVMPRPDGSVIFSGRDVIVRMERDQVVRFHDRRSGLTYVPADTLSDTGGVRRWNVTNGAGTQVGTWEGSIVADKGTGQIVKTGREATITYRTNGIRETKYPGGATEIETPGRGTTVNFNGHTIEIAPRPVTRPGQPDGRAGQPGPGPQRGDVPPGPQPGPVPGPQPGDRPQPPPHGRQGGDQPFPQPQPRPQGGDGQQPTRPTPERPPQPRPDQGPRADQALIDQLMNLFRLLQQRFAEQPEQLRGRPPLLPPGLDLAQPRRLVGTPRVVTLADGSQVCTYTYEEDAAEPRFYAVEQSKDGKVVERSVLYRQPQTLVFQAERGQPPIRLDNVTQSVTKLAGDTYTTTVTCIGADGRPVNYEFKTRATDGTVTQSPPLENRPASEFRTWTPAHIQALSPEFASKLTALQIKEIPPDTIAALRGDQIQRLTPDTVAAMTAAQVQRLAPETVAALTEAQLEKWTQASALIPVQVLQLSREQAKALLRSPNHTLLTPEVRQLLYGIVAPTP